VKLVTIWKTARTRRYHTEPTDQGGQNVADHTFGTMLIMNYLWPYARKEVFIFLMTHDLPESFTGDSPAPAKRKNPKLWALLNEMEEDWLHENEIEVPELDDLEHIQVHVCDGLEALLYSAHQVAQGNRLFGAMVARALKYVGAEADKLHESDASRIRVILQEAKHYADTAIE